MINIEQLIIAKYQSTIEAVEYNKVHVQGKAEYFMMFLCTTSKTSWQSC